MYYQEIYIYSDPETPRHVLREKVFAALHLAFINSEKDLNPTSSEITEVRFGVSFPNYHAASFELEYTLRIFAPEQLDLKNLDLNTKLRTVKDYLRLGGILPVPENVTHASFKRKQVKSGLERLARRQVKNGKAPSYELALERLKEKAAKTTKLPYIYATTSSTGKHRVPIFIDQLESEQEDGTFTTYGLSKDSSTVPIF